MILRKGDFTKKALQNGLWDSLLEKAGVTPDSHTSEDTEVEITACFNATRPLPAVFEIASIGSKPSCGDVISRMKRQLYSQISESPEMVRMYIHELENAGCNSHMILRLIGLQECIRRLELFIEKNIKDKIL